MSALDEILDETGFQSKPGSTKGRMYSSRFYHADLKRQFKYLMLELIGEDNPHSPDAKAHIDNPEYSYACCERVQSSNRTLQAMRKKVEWL